MSDGVYQVVWFDSSYIFSCTSNSRTSKRILNKRPHFLLCSHILINVKIYANIYKADRRLFRVYAQTAKAKTMRPFKMQISLAQKRITFCGSGTFLVSAKVFKLTEITCCVLYVHCMCRIDGQTKVASYNGRFIFKGPFRNRVYSFQINNFYKYSFGLLCACKVV